MAMVKTGPARDHVAMDPQNVALVASVFVAAGLVKGVSGMGLPTLSMALLGLFMPPAAAAALMVLPSLATNLSQCTGPYVRTLAQRLWPRWVGLVVVTVFSPTPDLGGSGAHARLACQLDAGLRAAGTPVGLAAARHASANRESSSPCSRARRSARTEIETQRTA